MTFEEKYNFYSHSLHFRFSDPIKHIIELRQFLRDYGWQVVERQDMVCPVCGEVFEYWSPGSAFNHEVLHLINKETGQLSLFGDEDDISV